MTKRESTYLERLKARRSVLAARLALTPKEASFRAEIVKEYKAMNWAVEKISRLYALEELTKQAQELKMGY